MSSFNAGQTTAGSSSGAFSGLTGNQITLTQAGVLQSCTVFWAGNAGINILMGVYADSGGVPGALLAQSAPATSTGTTQTLAMSTNPTLAIGTYWVVVQTQSGVSGHYDAGSGLGYFMGTPVYDGIHMPNPAPSGSTGAFTFSLYATFNTVAAADFPLTVADTSTVSHLDFHTGGHFPIQVADTSTVAITFHQAAGITSFTVGPTSPGGSTGSYTGLSATKVTMAQNGVLQSISINWFSNAGNNFILGVYTDNAGVPGTLIASTAVGVSVVGLQTLATTSNPAMANGSSYWIAVLTQNPIGGYFDATGTGAYFNSQPWTGTMPTTWGGATVGAVTFSLYATLNSGSAPLHFAMAIADTSTVLALSFHGAAIVKRFPVIVADTSTVAITFHQLASSFKIGPAVFPGSNTGTYTGSGATQFTSPQSGTLQSLSIQWFSDAGGLFLLGVWADNAGVPGALLATTAVGTSIIGVQTLPTTTHPIILSGQKYWIGVQVNQAIGGYYDTGGVAASNEIAWTGSLPDPWTSGGGNLSYTFSLYATATPGIAGFPMKIADTSTVTALGFEGAPKRFPLVVDSISTVTALSYHGATLLTARYIKTAATGTGSGLDWNNAAGIALINTAAAPDFCFYLAGGTYPGQFFNTGGTVNHNVVIRRASSQDPLCTQGTGWNIAYDSLVIFTGGFTCNAQYITVDGNKWNPPGLPTQWGIQCSSTMGNRTVDISISNCWVRNVEIIGPGFNSATSETDQIFLGINSRVSGCKIHDSDTLIFTYPGNPGFLIEYNYIFNSSSVITDPNETTPNPPHPDVAYSNQGWQNCIFRWNVVCNSVSEAFFFDTQTNSATTMLLYGNVLFQGDSQGDTVNGYGSVQMQFKEGSAQTGPIYYYHNTIVDWVKSNNLSEGRATIDPGSVFQNNLYVGTGTEWPAANMKNNGYWNYQSGPVGLNYGSNPTMLAANPFDQTQAHPYVYDPGNPATNPTGTPPATRVYINLPKGYDPAALGYVNSFKLAAGSLAIGAANVSGLPTSMFGYAVTVNTDMNGNTGSNLGAFQPPGVTPPPGALHFPMTIDDTSTVTALNFHGFIPVRFPVVVDDISTVTRLGFQNPTIRHFAMAIADVSRVMVLSFDTFATQHFPWMIADVSRVLTLGFENDHSTTPIVPPTPPTPVPPVTPGPGQVPSGVLTVPPYTGSMQPTQVVTNPETEAREATYSTFPHVVPPNTDSTLGGTPGTTAP